MVEKLFAAASEYKDELMLYGLALVPLLAGVSKFYSPILWRGYHLEILNVIPVTELIILSGAVEVALAVALIIRRYSHLVAALTGFWLFAITLQVAYKGLWTIALRDLGLAIFAFAVALNEYKISNS